MTEKNDTAQKAFSCLGNMAIFYKMMSRDDQNLIGMLDILDSNDPCICFFLDSEHQEVLMTERAQEDALKVRYQLNEELYEEDVSFRAIETFLNTIKENIETEVLKKPIFKN